MQTFNIPSRYKILAEPDVKAGDIPDLAEVDGNLVFDVGPGFHIALASQIVCAIAVTLGRPCSMTFNAVDVQALPDSEPEELVEHYNAESDRRREEYRNSPEGKAAAAERSAEIVAKQSEIDRMQRELAAASPDAGHDFFVDWCARFGWVNDDIGVSIDRSVIISALKSAGYVQNDCTGDQFVEGDRDVMARYIVGQALSCLNGPVGKIHPVVGSFADRYRAMEA